MAGPVGTLVAFGVANPVLSVALLLALVGGLLAIGYLFIASVWKYLVWGIAAFIAYQGISSGVIQQAVEHMRSDPQKYVMVGIALIGLGVATPYVVTPQTYADVQLQLSYNLTSEKGWFGFIGTTIDVNSIDSKLAVLRAYEGMPNLRFTKGVPEYKSAPDAGWWVCISEGMGQVSNKTYCWEIPGANIFVRTVSGDRQHQGYYLEALPLSAEQGVLTVTVYNNRMPVWADQKQYVITDNAVPYINSVPYFGDIEPAPATPA